MSENKRYVEGSSFGYKGEQVYLRVSSYHDRSIAISIESREGPVARLTVCLVGERLGRNEIMVKTWSENEKISQAALATGMFVDTGRRVRAGFCEAQVWRIAGDYELQPPYPKDLILEAVAVNDGDESIIAREAVNELLEVHDPEVEEENINGEFDFDDDNLNDDTEDDS
jgi:hypothetical protein